MHQPAATRQAGSLAISYGVKYNFYEINVADRLILYPAPVSKFLKKLENVNPCMIEKS
jgi:hypothetical protein